MQHPDNKYYMHEFKPNVVANAVSKAITALMIPDHISFLPLSDMIINEKKVYTGKDNELTNRLQERG